MPDHSRVTTKDSTTGAEVLFVRYVTYTLTDWWASNTIAIARILLYLDVFYVYRLHSIVIQKVNEPHKVYGFTMVYDKNGIVHIKR